MAISHSLSLQKYQCSKLKCIVEWISKQQQNMDNQVVTDIIRTQITYIQCKMLNA